MSIIITVDGKKFEVDSFVFSGGESHVKFKDLKLGSLDKSIFAKHHKIKVFAKIYEAKTIMELLLVHEIIDRVTKEQDLDINLEYIIPYLPYSRQDRVTVHEEAFSLEVFGKILNSLTYYSKSSKTRRTAKITTYDVHSDAAFKLIPTLNSIYQETIIHKHKPLLEFMAHTEPMIVSPDKGAFKKASQVAKVFGLPFISADKVRDPATGNVTHTHVGGERFIKNNHVLIVDDICDGGRTFIELAKILQSYGAKTVSLYVTHGIFSKGLGVFEDIIQNVFTTDTFNGTKCIYPEKPKIHTIPLMEEIINEA